LGDSVVRLASAVVLSRGFPLLSGVDLEVNRGSLVVITGPNGAGKTSLLRLVGGLDPLTSGSGVVAGVDLSSGDRRQLRRRVGWLGHEGSFYADLSVRENLVFAARALSRPVSDVDVAISRVGLEHRGDTLTKKLSAGQRRRMGLAWLLVRRPELWLLDEPYASLDEDGRIFFDGLLAEVLAGGATVLVSAHDALRSAALSPRTLVMSGGRLLS
jgi:heme ABC exporter ATP-binding subunit CcmA